MLIFYLLLTLATGCAVAELNDTHLIATSWYFVAFLVSASPFGLNFISTLEKFF